MEYSISDSAYHGVVSLALSALVFAPVYKLAAEYHTFHFNAHPLYFASAIAGISELFDNGSFSQRFLHLDGYNSRAAVFTGAFAGYQLISMLY